VFFAGKCLKKKEKSLAVLKNILIFADRYWMKKDNKVWHNVVIIL
jgi:hypothetical protein